MKKNIQFLLIITLSFSLFGCGGQMILTENTYAHTPNTITYQKFYDELSPYGRWVDYPGYGYVWSPTEPNFRPYYSNGYWGNTNMGWSWISNYNWGWGPFHYGRWFYETGYGWLWLPGYEWAPAWVSWRNHAEYYGWAPLPPGMNFGFSMGINIPYEHWAFVQHGYLNTRNFRDYCVAEHQNEIIIKNSVYINNTSYSNNKVLYAKGPDTKEVVRYSGQKINPVNIRDHSEQAKTTFDNEKREMHIFKPVVNPPQQHESFKPKETIPYKDLPHDNGNRGTWTTPPKQGNQKSQNPKGGGNLRE